MTNGAFQTSYAPQGVANSPGSVENPNLADIQSRKAVETAAGIVPGVVVSRGTDKENQVAVGAADIYGITVRGNVVGDATADNNGLYRQYEPAGVIRSGYVWANVTATGAVAAGSRALFADDATGAIHAGTASTGQTNLAGVSLETSIAGAGTVACLLKIDDIRESA